MLEQNVFTEFFLHLFDFYLSIFYFIKPKDFIFCASVLLKIADDVMVCETKNSQHSISSRAVLFVLRMA